MNLDSLLQRALSFDKFAIGRLIRLFEDPRLQTASQREKVLDFLRANHSKKATFFGFTGPPGVGKSSVLACLTQALLEKDETLLLAVLAIDPSSPSSGGSLLGDRTRFHMPQQEHRFFFRSQPTNLALGGVGKNTYQVCRFLSLLFDVVLIETVGIGQNEMEIQHLVDYMFLFVQPFSGDQVQFIKAGIMEVPDAFIVNKCDETSMAQTSFHMLKTTLHLLDSFQDTKRPVFRTSAKTNEGVTKLAEFIMERYQELPCLFGEKEEFFFQHWVKERYGSLGFEFYSNEWKKRPQRTSFGALQSAFHRDFLQYCSSQERLGID